MSLLAEIVPALQHSQAVGDLCVLILHPLAPLQGKPSGEPLGNKELKLGFGS